MKKIGIAALLLLTVPMLLAGCIRIIPPPSTPGEGSGSIEDMISEQQALDIAEQAIATDFPDMVDAEKMSQSYASNGREFYEFTYKRMIQVEADGEILEITRIVIVTIDKNTGEEFIAVSK